MGVAGRRWRRQMKVQRRGKTDESMRDEGGNKAIKVEGGRGRGNQK